MSDAAFTDLALDLGLPEPSKPGSTCEVVSVNGTNVQVTPVFYAYWRFAAERQLIFYRRLNGAPGRLTDDPVLRNFKFTNAYRASDRVSQYLIRNVIYRDDLPDDEVNLFFRILLFKLFNKIETWTFLEDRIGLLTWETFNFKRYDTLLTQRMNSGQSIYSAAYIMPSVAFGHKLKHQNHLRMLEWLIQERYPSRLVESKSMADAYTLLRQAPSIGPFLAYQYATDLNYSPLTDFAEDEFVVAGPGAVDGIHKCFSAASDVSLGDIIRYMWEHQDKHFSDQGIHFPSLWGRPLQLIDCQNVFCEISKYARVAFPEYGGVAGRTRIKQKFQSSGALLAGNTKRRCIRTRSRQASARFSYPDRCSYAGKLGTRNESG
jgi:alpha-glutamyl/putrescinyl thymine pyrophosphorylase clade 1